jgi:ubiquinol-cytochrome c reductase cytochrome c subunit
MIPKSLPSGLTRGWNRFSGKIMRKKKRGAVMRIKIRVALAGIVAALVLANTAALAASAENGKIAYVKHGCWQCHGFLGQGSVATSGGTVLAPSALTFDIFKNFVRSTNRTMPPYREAILSDADLADIYAYLQAIPKPPDANSIPLLKQ